MELSQDNKHDETVSSFPYLEAYEKQKQDEFSQLYNYIHREPALVLTILYICISLIGILYLAIVLYGFNINVLPHVELTDFVLSAIHYPKTLVIFLLMFLVILSAYKLESFLARKWEYARKRLNQYHKRAKHKKPLLLFTSFILLYLAMAAYLQAEKRITTLKEGEQRQFNVQLNSALVFNDKKVNKLNKVQIVANLSKHLWLYQKSSEQIFMVGHENVLILSPTIKTKQAPPETVSTVEEKQKDLSSLSGNNKVEPSTESVIKEDGTND